MGSASRSDKPMRGRRGGALRGKSFSLSLSLSPSELGPLFQPLARMHPLALIVHLVQRRAFVATRAVGGPGQPFNLEAMSATGSHPRHPEHSLGEGAERELKSNSFTRDWEGDARKSGASQPSRCNAATPSGTVKHSAHDSVPTIPGPTFYSSHHLPRPQQLLPSHNTSPFVELDSLLRKKRKFPA